MDTKKAPTQTTSTQKKSKLERIEERIEQLEERKKAIQARENEKKRKERTSRLIQIGAIAIKYLNCQNDIEPQEFEKRIKIFSDEIHKDPHKG